MHEPLHVDKSIFRRYNNAINFNFVIFHFNDLRGIPCQRDNSDLGSTIMMIKQIKFEFSSDPGFCVLG